MLAEPTQEAIALVKQHAPNGVVEVGAGEGHWLAAMRDVGIACVGYDPHPRGPLVLMGDHRDAAKHSNKAFLAVWPPDGNEVFDWISEYQGDTVIVVASWGRIWQGQYGMKVVADLTLPPGPKGGSVMRIFKRHD